MIPWQALPRHVPSDIALGLIDACSVKSRDERIKRIDALTDDAVEIGVCRPRSDASRSAEWERMRAPGLGFAGFSACNGR